MKNLSALLINNLVTRRNPVSLVHFITNRCNARCPFCFIDSSTSEFTRGELSVEEIDKMTRTVGPLLQNVNLTGGEPFLRSDLIDIARCWFRNTSIRSMYITSNGSLPDQMLRFAQQMVKEFPDRTVIYSLSIDSLHEHHDRIRKFNGLFDLMLQSYHALQQLGRHIMVNASITVSQENYPDVSDTYNSLIKDYGIQSITATMVRSEGVYEIADEQKAAIVAAYRNLTAMIRRDLCNGRLQGYSTHSLQGRLMNKKNILAYKMINKTLQKNSYISRCFAGSLFGVISTDGTVSPCELLQKSFGNVRDYEYDFGRLWHDNKSADIRTWIKESCCHCTYECAWSFNILGNFRYQPALLIAALKRCQ